MIRRTNRSYRKGRSLEKLWNGAFICCRLEDLVFSGGIGHLMLFMQKVMKEHTGGKGVERTSVLGMAGDGRIQM